MPPRKSLQWCTVSSAIAASNAPSRKGRASATPRTTGAASGVRCAIITPDGSTATTARSRGSYDPVPAPTSSTEAESPSAARMRRLMAGSGWRCRSYPRSRVSCALDCRPVATYGTIVDGQTENRRSDDGTDSGTRAEPTGVRRGVLGFQAGPCSSRSLHAAAHRRRVLPDGAAEVGEGRVLLHASATPNIAAWLALAPIVP